MRDIKRFFDTGGRVGGVGERLLGGGMVPISQNALCFMHNLNSLPHPPFLQKEATVGFSVCLPVDVCVVIPPSAEPPLPPPPPQILTPPWILASKHFPCKSKVLAKMLSHVRAAADFRAALF